MAALRSGTAAPLCAMLALTATVMAAEPESAPRVEARSSDLLAVGIAHGERMNIHVSRLLDNAPLSDASVTVLLRGTLHPAVAEADGSFVVQTTDLALPGAAIVEFQIATATLKESLKGTLEIASSAGKPEDKNSARQLWWWVLNFAVCIGFLWLISKRRKSAESTADT